MGSVLQDSSIIACTFALEAVVHLPSCLVLL